ncbi:MAG TPA: asparagine synthase-related protein [Sphingomicrobium sp.]|nr:asparagine synthase-related protein [Sphingomicrobium sp.]
MSPRYLLLVAGEADGLGVTIGDVTERTGLEPVFVSGRIAVLANSACRLVQMGGEGCVIGLLFRRHGPARQVTSLAEAEAATIARSGGKLLLKAFWGGYVAAVESNGSVRVLRDPSATFPCYFTHRPGLAAFGSDADLLVSSCLARAELDFEEVGRQLFRAGVPSPSTALRAISELLAGFEVRAPDGLDRQQPCWSPWEHVADDEDHAVSAEHLSRTVAHCVHSWASAHGRLLVSVSGGLDSSIVAACLARAGADAVCLTMFADDPGGDERQFARALCERLGFPIVERPYRLEDIRIAEPLGIHLPRPRDRTQANCYEKAHLEVAAEVGAGAFMTGNGGDSVFGYSQSAAPAADRLLWHGLGLGVLHALLDICRQTGCSLFEAAAGAWRLALRPPRYRCRPDPLFLDPGLVAGIARAELEHFWLDAPADALPGKAAHIAWILRVQHCLEPGRGAYLPVLNPLMSQPIIEACLSIPSWKWRAGGRDRAVARQAFDRDLPPLVSRRRIKGSPSHFAARLLDHFRSEIRERLLDGHLVRNRIVDADAVEQMLAGKRPLADEQRVRILELTSAEAWLDHWAARAEPPHPAEAHVIAPVHWPPRSSARPNA